MPRIHSAHAGAVQGWDRDRAPVPFLASPTPCSLCRLPWNFWGRKLELLEAQGREGRAHATSSCCREPVICHPDSAAS